MAEEAMNDDIMSHDVGLLSPSQPQGRLAVIDEAVLMNTLETHQQQLQEMVQNEFNKRMPLDDAEHRDKQNDQYAINAVLAKNNELQQRIDSPQQVGDAVNQKCLSLKAERDTLRQKLKQEQQKSKELESKTLTLRSMLIPAHEVQLTDGEVVNKFTSLRSQILKLVKTTWRRDEYRSGVEPTKKQMDVLLPFFKGKVDLRYQDHRLRGVIFDFLHDFIFSARIYALDERFLQVDKYLGRIDDFMWMKLPNGSHDSIVNWRVATLKATADLRKGQHGLARTVQREIWNFFDILKTRSDESATEGRQLLEKFCHDAVDRSLMMRSTKDEYAVDAAPFVLQQPMSAYEHLVEEEASEPARSCDPESVAYLITSALVKLPNGNVEDKKVLEKAQAVVYR